MLNVLYFLLIINKDIQCGYPIFPIVSLYLESNDLHFVVHYIYWREKRLDSLYFSVPLSISKKMSSPLLHPRPDFPNLYLQSHRTLMITSFRAIGFFSTITQNHHTSLCLGSNPSLQSNAASQNLAPVTKLPVFPPSTLMDQ